MSNSRKAILLARTNGGSATINKQVAVLRKFAADSKIKVVGQITLPHCSASDYAVESHLTALLGHRRHDCDFGMVLVTDLSRISRAGVPRAMALIKRLSEAGVAVVTPDLGLVSDRLWESFPVMRKGWARLGKKRSANVPHQKKGDGSGGSNTKLADFNPNLDQRGREPSHGRVLRHESPDRAFKDHPEQGP